MAQAKKPKPQSVKKHPTRWRKDLNPAAMGGQNLGAQNLSDLPHRTAADDKQLSRQLKNFSDDELRQIPLVPAGAGLEQRAVYVDLRNPDRGPMTAAGDEVARAENLYAPKAEVPYEIWNRLLETLCAPAAEKPGGQELPERMIDETLAESFPASDPPAWTTGREPEKTAPGGGESRRKKSR